MKTPGNFLVHSSAPFQPVETNTVEFFVGRSFQKQLDDNNNSFETKVIFRKACSWDNLQLRGSHQVIPINLNNEGADRFFGQM